MAKHCLNCNTELVGRFCHQCGQKASTHRITFRHFLQHDLPHGLFHLDKGILYTLKCLILRPGQTVRKFLAGQRVSHYNIFALFIIVIALKTLIDYQISDDEVFSSKNPEADKTVNQALSHYYKLFYLLCIPLLSVFSAIFSRRLHYNYTEHIVFNAFLLTGGFFYALLASLFCYLTGVGNSQAAGLFLVAGYFLMGYFQATHGVYSFFHSLWRVLAILACFLLLLTLVLIAVVVALYGSNFEGSIMI